MNKKPVEPFTPQEIAEAHIPPHGFSPEEVLAAEAEMKKFRMALLREMTAEQRTYSDLIRLKLQMEDFLQHGEYSEVANFAAFLQQYLRALGKKQSVFADEISLHPTKLNQILLGKAEPNLPLAYRLESHSGGLIPAILW